MLNETNVQENRNSEQPSPKQFRTKFKEIFDAETTFGSSRAARLELLENVSDIIQEYIKHDCSIVYLHGKLKEAGYAGTRKELSEWLFSKGMRTKREIAEKIDATSDDSEISISQSKNSQKNICSNKLSHEDDKLNPENDQSKAFRVEEIPDPILATDSPSTPNANDKEKNSSEQNTNHSVRPAKNVIIGKVNIDLSKN